MNSSDYYDDLKTAGQVPPPSSEVLAHARRELDAATTRSRRRRSRRAVLVPVLASVGLAAAVIGAVAIHEDSSNPIPAPGQGNAASCAFAYSAAELDKRAFAFDGTVLAIAHAPAGSVPGYLVTFRVNEWFRPDGGAHQVTVRTHTPPEAAGNHGALDFPDYRVGSRLLITGEPLKGGADPLKDPVAWGCGFSRAYSPADAATWRKTLNE